MELAITGIVGIIFYAMMQSKSSQQNTAQPQTESPQQRQSDATPFIVTMLLIFVGAFAYIRYGDDAGGLIANFEAMVQSLTVSDYPVIAAVAVGLVVVVFIPSQTPSGMFIKLLFASGILAVLVNFMA